MRRCAEHLAYRPSRPAAQAIDYLGAKTVKRRHRGRHSSAHARAEVVPGCTLSAVFASQGLLPPASQVIEARKHISRRPRDESHEGACRHAGT